MLVLAIPKSASTALMKTLAERHAIAGRQVMFRENPVPGGYRLLGAYHSDVRTLTESDVESIAGNEFFKQHIPPTDENVRRLQHLPRVLLLREPEDIVLAYRRAEQAQLHTNRPEFQGCASESDWLERAADIGLLQELKKWTDGWTAEISDEQTVTYTQLMSDPASAVKRVEAAFGLDSPSGDVCLVQARYSRAAETHRSQSVFRSAVRWLRRRARSIVK